MREPHVFPLEESPFSPDVPPLERRRRVLEVGADVVTDEAGLVVDFMSEADVEGVLSDPRFAAVALPTLQLSGVESGPLWDLLVSTDVRQGQRGAQAHPRRRQPGVHAQTDRTAAARLQAPCRCAV